MTNNILKWDTMAIATSAFNMADEGYFGINDELAGMFSEEKFSELMIQTLTPCQPLSDHEQVFLTSAVKSKNRTRILYSIDQVISRHISAVVDTQGVGLNDEESQVDLEQNYTVIDSEMSLENLDNLGE